MKPDLHEANRLSWNAATVAHNSHKGDQAAFFRKGCSTLFPEEAGLLGERLDEYPYANGWKPFEGMRDIGGRRMAPPEGMPRIPLMYSISARKP